MLEEILEKYVGFLQSIFFNISICIETPFNFYEQKPIYSIIDYLMLRDIIFKIGYLLPNLKININTYDMFMFKKHIQNTNKILPVNTLYIDCDLNVKPDVLLPDKFKVSLLKYKNNYLHAINKSKSFEKYRKICEKIYKKCKLPLCNACLLSKNYKTICKELNKFD